MLSAITLLMNDLQIAPLYQAVAPALSRFSLNETRRTCGE